MTISRSKIDPLLVLILVLAGAVRFWGIGFGLPGTLARPDESVLIRIALRFGSGDFNPHFFNYPSLFVYVLFALYAPYYVIGKWMGGFGSSADFVARFAFEPTPFFLIARSLSALSGVATVYLVYRMAGELFGKVTARVSALFLALAFLAVRDSHFGVTDTFAAAFVCGSMLFVAKAWRTQMLGHYVLAAVLAGLAASTKYYGILLVAPLLLACIMGERFSEPWVGRARLSIGRMSLVVACIPAAFLIGTPYALLDFHKFTADFFYEQQHLNLGHFGIVLDRGWWHHLTFTLFYGLGWPMLLAALAGIVVLLWTAPRKALLLSIFPLMYYAVAGKGHTVFVRYMIPVVPFFCITAAVLIVALGDRLTRIRPDLRSRVVAGLAILVLLPSIYSIVRFDLLLIRTDSRVLAARWITSHVEPGSSVLQAGSDWTDLSLYPSVRQLEKELAVAEGPKVTSLKGKIDYLMRKNLHGYERVVWNPVMAALPSCIVLFETPFPQDRTDPALAKLVQTRYRLEQSFLTGNKTGSENLYDPQDTFYIPYAGFRNIQRPGPNISIYFLK